MGELILSIVQGRDITLNVSADRDEFDGPIQVAVRNLPSGVTANLSATELTPAVPNITVTVSATLTAALGTSTVFVDATAEDIGTRTVELQLTVLEPPGFTIAVLPNDITITLGQSATATMSFTRKGGFADQILMGSNGLPDGVSVIFDPTLVTTSSAVATFSADLTASLATATASINATAAGGAGSGIEPRNAPVTLRFLPAPAIETSLSQSFLSLVQGQGGTVDFFVDRINFAGPVTMALSGLPAGVSYTLFQNPVPIGVSQVSIAFIATSTASVGQQTVVIEAQGDGVAKQTEFLLVGVAEAPGFALDLQDLVSLTAGATTTASVSLARRGAFTQDVALSATGLPSGVTASFNPTSVGAGNLSEVTFTAVSSTVAATYSASLVGASAGFANQSAPFQLEILPLPSISTSLNAASLSIARGSNGAIQWNVARINFAGGVNLALLNVPSGVTPSFSGNPVPNGVGMVDITFAAAAGATLGTTQVTIEASGAGITTQSNTFDLVVTDAPGFGLTIPTAVTVTQGQSVTFTASLARVGGFSNGVTFASSNLPVGMTATFNPSVATGNESVVTLVAPLSTVAATTTASITGSAAGFADQVRNFELTVLPEPAITASLSTSTLSVTRGSNGSILQATLDRISFTGDVTLALLGVPANVTPTFSVNPVPNGTSKVDITFVAALGATLGTAQVTLEASGTGISTRSTVFDLVITDAPGFALSIPAAVSVTQGQSVTFTASVARVGGFSDGVTMAASNLPSGMTATFNPAVATGNESAVTLFAPLATVAATTTASITGSATGFADRVQNFELTVAAAPAITTSLSTSTLSVTQGANNSLDLALGRINFADDVDLSVLGLPAGVTPSYSVNPVPNGVPLVTLQFNATTTATTGTSQVTVRASGVGIDSKDALFDLTVNSSATPGYTLALDPSIITVSAGVTTTATVQINRIAGFAENVALAANNLPAGVSATFDPQEPTGNSSTVSFSTLSTTVPTNVFAQVVGTTSLNDVVAQVQIIVPGFAIELANPSLTVQRGSSNSVFLHLDRREGYAGDITVSAPSLPAGVTMTPAMNPVPNGTTLVNLTFTATSTATLGDADITIEASGAGAATRTTLLDLSITDPPGFTLSLPLIENTFSVQRGQTATFLASIDRTGGFAGDVTMAQGTSPTGVTATFNPTIVSGNSSVVTWTVAANAPTVTATPTAFIFGSASGFSNRVAGVGLPCLVETPLAYGGATVTASVAGGDCDFFRTIIGGETDTYVVTTTSATSTMSFGYTSGTGSVFASLMDGQSESELTFGSLGSTRTRKFFAPPGTYKVLVEGGTVSGGTTAGPTRNYTIAFSPEANASFGPCVSGGEVQMRPFPAPGFETDQALTTSDCLGTNRWDTQLGRTSGSGTSYYHRVRLALVLNEGVTITMSSTAFVPTLSITTPGSSPSTFFGSPSQEDLGNMTRYISTLSWFANTTGIHTIELNSSGINNGANVGQYMVTITKN